MNSFFKRLFDILLSLLFLIILSPLLLIIMIIISISSKESAIFTQERLGKNNRVFKIYKFRTMNNSSILLNDKVKKEYEKNYKLKNDPRVTKIGLFLRKYAIDELPQLINILKGDMSIVGPRPIVEKEALLYKNNIKKLLSIRPGLTGAWIVNGYHDINYYERMKIELGYVKKHNLFIDMKIILKTICVVFKGKGM